MSETLEVESIEGYVSFAAVEGAVADIESCARNIAAKSGWTIKWMVDGHKWILLCPRDAWESNVRLLGPIVQDVKPSSNLFWFFVPRVWRGKPLT